MEEDSTPPHGAQVQWPSAPVYDWSSSPASLTRLGAIDPEVRSGVRDNFWRSARWCSDGSAVLSTTEDRAIRVHTASDLKSLDLTPVVIEQPDAIHSTLWYPSASAHSPETYCFVASIRDTPVRLVDASDGRIRATYPIVDHRERFIAPHSLAFNPSATKLYCGFENAIEVFDVASPGYDNAERLKTVYAKREKGGQKGIISALAFCTDYSGTFAAGSFSGSVVLYSEDTGSTLLAHVDGVKGGGVTQVAFHPLSPTTMFVASRRSSSIQIYDTRDLSAPVSEYQRPASTNQRISFDVDPWGRWLSSGDEHGVLRVWDISGNVTTDQPIFEKKLHDDAIGSVQFYPYQPLLLTCSGSRDHHRVNDISSSDSGSVTDSDSDSDSSLESDSEESAGEAEDKVVGDTHSRPPVAPGLRSASRDATLRVWSVASPTVPATTTASAEPLQSASITTSHPQLDALDRATVTDGSNGNAS
ncbi:hypothetical protein IAU59_005081 [Kwoniella sp. CBS 9459]